MDLSIAGLWAQMGSFAKAGIAKATDLPGKKLGGSLGVLGRTGHRACNRSRAQIQRMDAGRGGDGNPHGAAVVSR